MAFNPFASFRKYQKIWMPIILLLCMATFVLCSGSKGDFAEWLMGLFGRREGAAIAKVGGRSVYRKDLYDLKEQRNTVNEFMKRAAEFAIKKLNALADSPEIQKMPQGQERAQLLARLTEYKGKLEARAVKPRYFDTGVTLDELVDFKVWQHEADRLGVNLIPEHVKTLLNDDLFALAFFRDYGYKIFEANERDLILTLLRDMRATSQRVSETMIFKALNDEYRVRIAQKALALSDPYLEMDSELTTRIPLSPAMLWDHFKENRLTFDVALIPIEVSKFTSQVPQPTEADLQSMFKARARIVTIPLRRVRVLKSFPARASKWWSAIRPRPRTKQLPKSFWKCKPSRRCGYPVRPGLFWNAMWMGPGPCGKRWKSNTRVSPTRRAAFAPNS